MYEDTPLERGLTFQLYRDDLFDARLLQTHLVERLPLDLPTTRRALDGHLRTFEAIVGRADAAANMPLGPLSDRQAWLTAWQLVATYGLVADESLRATWSDFVESLRIAAQV